MTSPTTSVPAVTLNDGHTIPQLGFGVFQVPAEETYDAVTAALQAGYRSIDTAKAYGNEAAVGRAIADSGLPRGELFVTTKLWNDDHGHDSALQACDASLAELGLDYLDLYLIHWPTPERDRYVASYRAFEELQAAGKVRSIGVSNFTIDHLTRLMDETSVVPVVNQVELHPNFTQKELRAFHKEHGIVTEAWSPLAQGDLLADPALVAIGEAHGKTAAQVVLRWHVQLGNVAIPKSVTPERIAANIDVFDFELTGDEMVTIDTMGNGERRGPDPDTFNG
ncbi:aldo/keto reductase [Rhodococcus sp. X156]|uniref:aldo/keto reductase n=1 Tax=Rhodococcus sp. X156 TaxID=2499145 RepID=UPI000FDCA046|nr:aldo/keto reductase [Rhodococcus sp. X156]